MNKPIEKTAFTNAHLGVSAEPLKAMTEAQFAALGAGDIVIWRKMSAGDLAAHFDISRPTLSVHFNKLKEAGLVTVERQGTSLIYHLNMSILEEALSGFLAFREPKS